MYTIVFLTVVSAKIPQQQYTYKHLDDFLSNPLNMLIKHVK
jgi:hypothetical protein